MSEFGNITEFVGRRFDALAFRGADRSGESLLSQSLFDEASSGAVVTGVYKLSQRFLLELLTAKGSIPFRPERGTDFIREVQSGRIRSEQDATLSFNFALVDVQQNLQAEEDDFTAIPMPDDERFDRAELETLTLIGDFLQLTTTVFSLAGTSRTVVLPLKTLPIDSNIS